MPREAKELPERGRLGLAAPIAPCPGLKQDLLAGHAEMGVESVEPGTVDFSWQLWRCRARRAVRRGVPGLQPGRDQRVSRQSRRCQPAALPDLALDHDWCADGTVCDRAARGR